MAEYNIYQDISERSGGDVYIGVVGPVGTYILVPTKNMCNFQQKKGSRIISTAFFVYSPLVAFFRYLLFKLFL